MTHTRIHFTIRGGHVHTEFYSAGAANLTHGKNGDLTFTLAEWATLLPTFERFSEVFELIDDDKIANAVDHPRQP